MARFREVSIIPELSIVMECPPKPYERFKELLPSLTEHTKSIGGQLYEIRPTTVHEEYHSILGEHSSIGDVLDERGKKKHIANFPCSATLYEFCKGSVGKRPKIVTDAYSVERSEILFAAFSELEVRLRKRIVKDENLNRMIDDLNLEGIRLKDGNHKVSNMTLFEIITLVLMSPCSENYYLERVEESDRSNEALATLRGLRVLDEVYFPLNFEELDRLRNIRNACMHFKIITHDDFLFCTQSINKYISSDILKDSTKIFKNVHLEISNNLQRLATQFKGISDLQIRMRSLTPALDLLLGIQRET